MESWQLAILLKPFVVLVFFGCIVIPIEMLLSRHMKDGKLKRILFTRINGRRNR